jgi:hypothetical protein
MTAFGAKRTLAVRRAPGMAGLPGAAQSPALFFPGGFMRKAVIVIVLLALPQSASAWGGTGHRYIGELAARNFPKEIPGFLRTPQAERQIGLMAQEPDISRNTGQPHDADSDPGHYLKVSDDGTILGGPLLNALPATRRDFDTALRLVSADQYKAGFLPYNIMDGYQQLVKDFALLRMDVAAATFAEKFKYTKAVRKRFVDARVVRQVLTLRDLGVWAHYVGDASQPMHASIHLLSWSDGPNPNGFTTALGLHGKFESDFVDAHVRESDVATALRPPRDCGCAIAELTRDYLLTSWKLLVPTYQFEKDAAYDAATPQAKAFTVERLAAGAAMLRDMVAMAWRESGTATLGYLHKMTVADIEAGKADPALLE